MIDTSGREYQPRLTVEEAGSELARSAGRQFDPEIVETFASLGSRSLDPHAEGSAYSALLG